MRMTRRFVRLSCGVFLVIVLVTRATVAQYVVDEALASAFTELKADPELQDEQARHRKLMEMADQYSQFAEAAFQALAELKQIGGVLVHFDDRKPDRPVIAVDFTNHPNFQEAWLKHLAAFPQLSTLGLAEIPLTDAGMRYLKTLTELETLTLTGTKITDEGLAELLKLKKLRHLDVRGTPVTGTGVTVLRRFLPALEIASGSLSSDSSPPPVAESPLPKPPHENPAILSVVEINELREKAAALSQPVEGQAEPQGWSKSRVDPGKLVQIFAPLRMRKGYVLRAYVFREEGNGNGVVWAMPEDADFPAPKDCPTLENHLLKAPKPWDALDDPMEAIEGDGSAWSYLAASLLRRELREFGAMWHGSNWATHFLLDDDPWKNGAPSNDASPLERPDEQGRPVEVARTATHTVGSPGPHG